MRVQKSRSDSDSKIEELAWQVMICSVFRQSERQTLNLIISSVGVTTPKEATTLLRNIFCLIRRGVIYIPEARLKIFHDAPELVDVYMIRDFDEVMRELAHELRELRVELKHLSSKRIPRKVLIDLKNYAEGKYIQAVG
ncbi:MAG: hypothetical protein JSV04_01540 [Candidatus Heimdallarchaeota archaeon]|nr:MAG: hypothetical protein JSV04_01540 [Candidatus Heimdallarchaeota archaeon]